MAKPKNSNRLSKHGFATIRIADRPLIQTFDEIKHRQTYKEVADVANGAYDWKIERTINDSIKI